MRTTLAFPIILASLGLAACAARDERASTPVFVPLPPHTSDVESPSPPALPPVRPTPRAGAPVSPPPDRVLLVTDAGLLAALEQDSLGFWKPFRTGSGTPSTAELARTPHFRSLAAQVRTDVQRQQQRDRHAGIGMRHSHRLFDPAWLTSTKTRFELIGVVNRTDRRWFAPERCGETRLVYRLAYTTTVRGQVVSSRLPMTVSMVFWQEPSAEGCKSAVERWPRPWQPDLADALVRGPLAAPNLTLSTLKSVELNYQLVRWPSTVRPNMAGHAEYVLRVFQVLGQRLTPVPLENTPDVARLGTNAALRRELLAWLREPANVRAVDAGTATLPSQFLAREAISVSPHGLGRLANRPFRSLFAPDELLGLAYDTLTVARSPSAYLRRLDGMSCAGCHQSRSTAGFHLLGEERHAQRVDALEVPISPHLSGDLPRRALELRAALDGSTSAPARGLSDHEAVPGQYGAHCALGSDDADEHAFADFRCAPGLACISSGDPELGSCLPEPGTGHGGDPCEGAVVRTNLSPYDDDAAVSQQGCRSGGCFTNHGGFPHGMCAESCDRPREGTACGLVPITLDFSSCVAGTIPFTECVRTMAERAALRACDATHACRDDYVCARAIGEGGVCLPTYFLFQLRVDGHDGV